MNPIPSPSAIIAIAAAPQVVQVQPVVNAFTGWLSATAQLVFILYAAYESYKSIKKT